MWKTKQEAEFRTRNYNFRSQMKNSGSPSMRRSVNNDIRTKLQVTKRISGGVMEFRSVAIGASVLFRTGPYRGPENGSRDVLLGFRGEVEVGAMVRFPERSRVFGGRRGVKLAPEFDGFDIYSAVRKWLDPENDELDPDFV